MGRLLRTDAGAAAILFAAAAVALIWANAAHSEYEAVWHNELALHAGGFRLALDLREAINSGLMTMFFFVVGLEARRELDLGELRERRRLVQPVLASAAAMAAAVVVYVALNAGHGSPGAWGTVISTDTAAALGVLALTGPRRPGRLRSFILSIAVVDDVVCLGVIGVAYNHRVHLVWLACAAAILAVVVVVHAARIPRGAAYPVLGIAAWLAVQESGVDPVLVGLLMGLLTYAHPVAGTDLERATEAFRGFRQQPTPELARQASAQLFSAISPNERLEHHYHPWTSYLIVPVFVLANAGVPVSAGSLARSLTSPPAIGILVACLAAKPVAITATAWLTARLSRGRLRPPVNWASVAGSGTVAGIGFTTSLLIAALALTGDRLTEAKTGILTASLAAVALSWLAFRLPGRLPSRARTLLLSGASAVMTELDPPVDPVRDHIRGPADAAVTVVEYADFECPYCGQAETAVTELLADRANVRFVWRHLPLTDIHPHAELAAEAAEAAAAQGAFWAMHDRLLGDGSPLTRPALTRYAAELGLDTVAFDTFLRDRDGRDKIAEDVGSAEASGVAGTPTFFVNGRRLHGSYDLAALSAAVTAALPAETTRESTDSPAGCSRPG